MSQEFAVVAEATILHPDWMGSVLKGKDVALIQLPEASSYCPLSLPFEDMPLSKSGELYVELGWGYMGNGSRTERLHQATSITSVFNDKCKEQMPTFVDAITDSAFCGYSLSEGNCPGEMIEQTCMHDKFRCRWPCCKRSAGQNVLHARSGTKRSWR